MRSQIPALVPPLNVDPIPQDPTIQEVNRDTMKQQAAAYVESIRLRMIAQGIPFEAPGLVGEAGLSTWVPVFDKLGPPPLVPSHPGDFRPRQVKSAVDIPPRKNQPMVKWIVEKRAP